MTKKHWIYIKRGLSEDPKHRAAMGECIWLYMHIIDRADWETGIAFDWKDKEEAAGMSMPVDTLRRQRQKLQELDYIRTEQKQHSQNIYIMEWKNPRDYGSDTKNARNQGSHEQPPLESQGDNQGLNQGSNQGLNQGQAQVKTPTYSSKSKSSSVSLTDAAAHTAFNTNATLTQANTILCNASGYAFLPSGLQASQETVYQLLQTYPEQDVIDALETACTKWKERKRKDDHRNYSALNPAWVDWAVAHLAGETPWKIGTQGKKLTTEEIIRMEAEANGY